MNAARTSLESSCNAYADQHFDGALCSGNESKILDVRVVTKVSYVLYRERVQDWSGPI
jgi:hypothetical protein